MQRLFTLCLWPLVLISILAMSWPSYAYQDGVRLRGPAKKVTYREQEEVRDRQSVQDRRQAPQQSSGQTRQTRQTSQRSQGETYGPTTEQDTLWNIATQVRPSPDISIYQVLQALFEANGQAFPESNMNHVGEGYYLQIPSEQTIRQIAYAGAKALAERHNQAWTVKSKPQEAAVKKKDLEAVKTEINEKLTTYGSEQTGRLETIQNDVSDSIDGLQAILKENEALRKKLSSFDEKLETMQNEVAKGKDIQPQMDDMLRLSQELLALAEAREQGAVNNQPSFLSSNLLLILLGTIPTFLFAGIALFFINKRKVTSAVASDVKTVTEPKPEVVAEKAKVEQPSLDAELSLDDELSIDLTEQDDEDDLFGDDLDSLDDELVSDSLMDDDVIHLDDDLDSLDSLDSLDDLDDISLDDDFSDIGESKDNDAQSDELEGGLLDQDDLNDLLSGLDEDDNLEGGELDQSDLDALLSGTAAPESEESEALPGGELGQDDLNALLAGLDDPDDGSTDESNLDDLDALLPDAPEPALDMDDGGDVTDPDDIDALLASAAAPAAPEIADGSDVTDPDDIDALLASAAAPAAPEIADGSDVTDPDDIDALLAAAAEPAEVAPEIPDGADVSDPDDIDALLNSVAATAPAPEIADGADVTDPDDIDALLNAAANAAPPATAPEIADGADVTDPDDIDALLNSAAPTATAPEIPDGADVTDPDDIDALLNAAANAAPPAPAPQIPDGADVTDPDDIDALLSAAANAVAALAVPAIADGAEVTDPDDIDALLSAAAPAAAPEIADGSDVTDPDDIDALLNAAAPVAAAPEIADGSEVTDPDDIDALLNAAASEAEPVALAPEIADDSDVTDADDIDALINAAENAIDPVAAAPVAAAPEITASPEEQQAQVNKGKIENFTQEYVAPFLAMDFSFMTESADDTAIDQPVIDEAVVDSAMISDELDIDALMSSVTPAPDLTDDSFDIGDDLSSPAENEPELGEIDKNLTNIDQDFSIDETEHVELTPDFTDENIISDLLGDEFAEQSDSSDAGEIADIDDFDNVDFEDLLANIENNDEAEPVELEPELELEELGDEFDIGDDLSAPHIEPIGNDDLDTDDLDTEQISAEEFVSIDALLSDNLAQTPGEELYNKDNIDVGLDDYPEFAHDEAPSDALDENGLATKLDLAKVYVEIGDVENAEVILQEIVTKGNEQQQEAAKALIAQLN